MKIIHIAMCPNIDCENDSKEHEYDENYLNSNHPLPRCGFCEGLMIVKVVEIPDEEFEEQIV